MDKMRMESVDMTEKNIDRIAALFPNCITGSWTRSVALPTIRSIRKL